MQGVFENIRIQGICSCVPSTVEKNEIYANIIGERRAKRQIKLIGVSQRHISNSAQMPSDLCYAATERLLSHLNWNKEDIKVLIFITQRPDYNLPSTAFFLHKRLGLSKDCLCFDINLGCSSFNVGIQNTAALLQNCELHEKALLLLGDTSSLIKSPYERYENDEIAQDMLFGSEGTCIAMEKAENGSIMFMNKSDGERYQAIISEFGQSTKMDGSAVFSFGIGDVPKTVIDFRDCFGIQEESIDYYVFHQAQQLMLDTIINKCNISPDKELRSLNEYGNTSGGSIPLTLNVNKERFAAKKSIRVLCCGFGVGLSWGCIYTEIPTENILPVFENDEHYRDVRSDVRSRDGFGIHYRNILIYNADSEMGEWVLKRLKQCGGKLALVGADSERLSEIVASMIEKPIIVTESNNTANELSASHFNQNALVLIGNVEYDIMKLYIDALSESLDKGSIGSVVICDSYTDNEEMRQAKKRFEHMFDDYKNIDNIRINAVLYNGNRVNMVQIRDAGQEWVNLFVSKGGPEEMVKASYVSDAVMHFLSRSAKFTNNSILTIE